MFANALPAKRSASESDAMNRPKPAGIVAIASSGARMEGAPEWPPLPPRGIALFAQGTGPGRHSPHNHFVAAELRRAGRHRDTSPKGKTP